MLVLVLSLIATLVFSEAAVAEPPQVGKPNKREFQVGEHIPLVIVERSVKRENVLVIYTQVDPNSSIVVDRKRKEPTVGFYWLQQRSRFKAPGAIAEWAVRRTFEIETNDLNSFYVHPKEKYLGRIKHDLSDHRVLVKAERASEGCVANAYLQLGPSDQNRLVRLEWAFGDFTRKSVLDFKVHVNYVTGRGVDARTGEKYERRFEGND